MKKILFVSADDGTLNFSSISRASHEEYAERYGYGYERWHLTPEKNGDSHPSWQKLGVLSYLVGKNGNDWIVWLDADTVITNQTIKFENHILPRRAQHEFMLVSKDWSDGSPWSAGVMAINPSYGAAEFLGAAELKTNWKNDGCWDQSAMHETWKGNRAYEHGIKILPRRILQSVPRECSQGVIEPWQRGDWLAHVTGIPHDRRRPLMEKFHTQAIR